MVSEFRVLILLTAPGDGQINSDIDALHDRLPPRRCAHSATVIHQLAFRRLKSAMQFDDIRVLSHISGGDGEAMERAVAGQGRVHSYQTYLKYRP